MMFQNRLTQWHRIETLGGVFVLLTVLLPSWLSWAGILPEIFPEWLQLLCLGTWILSAEVHTYFEPTTFGTAVEGVAKKTRKIRAAFFITGGLTGLALSLVKLLELKPLV